MGTLRIEPGATGWEAQTLPLCYAALPVFYKDFVQVKKTCKYKEISTS